MYSAGKLLLPTSQMLLARNAAVIWPVAGMVASVVGETQNLVTSPAFVTGTTRVSLAIRTSIDEICARPSA